MTQQVQLLIDKIKTEGVQAAERKAEEITAQARRDADKVVSDAKKQADQIIHNAQNEAKKLSESTQMALKQSSRDTILSLRKEIERVLQGILKKDVSDTLSSKDLASIIESAVKGAVDSKSVNGDIVINVNKDELGKLKDSLIVKLQKQVKTKIHLQSSSDVSSGFTISFDGGKSSFDFTDQSLADYLGTFLNPQVAQLIKESK